jgi:CRISPR/Cas system CMR-associated protein Cmr1 (group 7 of RAMP superfamily)
LTRLEDLVNQYESGDKTKKPELSQQILSEIDLLRRKNFKTKVNAERPLSIVGNIRGTKKSEDASPLDLAEHAVEISASHFYIRTYTIDHR